MPTRVSEEPQILTLDDLISLKLSSYTGSPIRRAQDYADAIKLIEANDPPRDFQIDPSVEGLYRQIWDSLHGD